jgi:hypothetical protein
LALPRASNGTAPALAEGASQSPRAVATAPNATPDPVPILVTAARLYHPERDREPVPPFSAVQVVPAKAVRRQLGLDLFARIWSRAGLSTEDADALAVEAQHQTRAVSPRRMSGRCQKHPLCMEAAVRIVRYEQRAFRDSLPEGFEGRTTP